MRLTRATARTTGAAALAVVTIALVASPADAAAYRYWTYWQAAPGAAAWAFATQGPGTSIPAEGSVEGWSFGVTTESGDPGDAPGQAPDFTALCAGTQAPAGSKRVGLVIDSGSAAVAPEGQVPPALVATCVVAPEDATGYDIVRSSTEVRIENGLVCGVGGYPTGECAPVLDDAQAQALLTAAEQPGPSADASPAPATSGMDAPDETNPSAGTPWATLAVAVLLIAGAALWAVGRRRER